MTHDPAHGAPPIQRVYDLSDLSQAGDEVRITAGADDLPRLARWFDVKAVERFEAIVRLGRKSENRFAYDAELTADLVQSCVVSLEPVRSHLALKIVRELHVLPRAARRRQGGEEGGVVTLTGTEDEGPEELDSPRYDLATPLLEELSLAIDPYPRAEGVEFELPAEAGEAEESPFAALKRLKQSS